eukprot:TRINITY_DN9126_c0_g1_i4.p1 TRINITY_DN9126_c0_g1~~TRINITY_DN9126_c0_g1_i4.p1  ORF type:complete len:589 (-),score=95.81 TRINITY_DN9126_c0_g1_i4:162-1928(-)
MNEHFETSTHVYIVLEYAKNGSLFSYLTKRRKLDEREACKYFRQCCLSIDYLHKKNIMHRDFKPENILLDDLLDVKLCDFGWCTDKTTEKKFAFCGTYEYMAPEMVDRKMYDETIDIWGLGILLYELIHGYSPFKGSSNNDVCQNIRRNHVVFNASISDDAKDLILRILKTVPSDRIKIEDILKHPFVVRMQQRSSSQQARFHSTSPTRKESEPSKAAKPLVPEQTQRRHLRENEPKPTKPAPTRCATAEGRHPLLERSNNPTNQSKTPVNPEQTNPPSNPSGVHVKNLYSQGGYNSARPPLGPTSNLIVNSSAIGNQSTSTSRVYSNNYAVSPRVDYPVVSSSRVDNYSPSHYNLYSNKVQPPMSRDNSIPRREPLKHPAIPPKPPTNVGDKENRPVERGRARPPLDNQKIKALGPTSVTRISRGENEGSINRLQSNPTLYTNLNSVYGNQNVLTTPPRANNQINTSRNDIPAELTNQIRYTPTSNTVNVGRNSNSNSNPHIKRNEMLGDFTSANQQFHLDNRYQYRSSRNGDSYENHHLKKQSSLVLRDSSDLINSPTLPYPTHQAATTNGFMYNKPSYMKQFSIQ